MNEDPEVKVTKIKNRWHGRVFIKGKLADEMACENRQDIAYICRTMLRWLDKTGYISKLTHAARKRLNTSPKPIGKIWYWVHLENERFKRSLKNGSKKVS